MSSELAIAIKLLIQEKGIPEELIKKAIEESLLAAYKKKFGTDENAVVKFSDDGTDVSIFAQKMIVEDLYDPVSEITLTDALEYNDECEVGDELLIEINPKDFDRISIQSAKQRTKQTLRDIQKDTLYSEYKDKVGEMVIGYFQRERNGTIYVDLGKIEGVLPKKFQSPREIYHQNDRIKSMIFEVNKGNNGLQIVLSRTHTEFVKKIFELEVPEIYDHTVEIFKIVREAGYRTKIAVYSNRDDVDPVGACVGLRGVRIQAVVRELEGEKIDILKYDPDSKVLIKNALSPAEIQHVILLDAGKKQALVVVDESQFSLAIGKQGLNVRLANRLVDWNIDVKTEKQFEEMDISADSKKAISDLFNETGEPEEEIVNISELPGISIKHVELLKNNKIELIDELVSMDIASLSKLKGITEEDANAIMKIIENNIEIVEENEEEYEETDEEVNEDSIEDEDKEEKPEDEESENSDTEEVVAEISNNEEDEEETYECPDCGGKITVNMKICPECGVGLSFEEE